MTATASTGDSTEGPAELAECARRVSSRKAHDVSKPGRPTGPRTEAGKRESSKNALKHGGYARTPVAIPRGRYAEDPEDVRRYVADLVESLHPRDAIESAHARRIATSYLKFDRMDRVAADLLGRADDEITNDDGLALTPGVTLEDHLAAERAVLDFFGGVTNEVDYEDALAVIVRFVGSCGHPSDTIPEPEAH